MAKKKTESNRDEDRMREICSTGSKDDILWVRKSSGLGINHEYALRQIVDGSGKKIGNKDQGPWKRYLDGVKGDTVLLARATKEVTFEEFISDREDKFNEIASDMTMGPGATEKLKRLNPGDLGCTMDVECLETRRCFKGRCQALLGQLQGGARCRLDEECENGNCEGNRWGWKDGKCQGLALGVKASEPENRCKLNNNPMTCDECVSAKWSPPTGSPPGVKSTNCAWCASLPTSVIRGTCVRSASYCPKGSSFFASKSQPFNLAHDSSLEEGGVTWRTGAEVVPFDMTNEKIDQCPVPVQSRHESLKKYFDSKDFPTTVTKLLSYKYASLDFFARSNYNALVSSYHAWMEAMPTSSGNVKNFDPPGKFIGNHIEQAFAGIKICEHDEDWIPVTAKEKRLTGLITKIPEGWGRANLVMTKKQDLKYFTYVVFARSNLLTSLTKITRTQKHHFEKTNRYYWDGKDPNSGNKAEMFDWGLGQLSSAPGQDDVILVSPKAKASIFEQGRTREW